MNELTRTSPLPDWNQSEQATFRRVPGWPCCIACGEEAEEFDRFLRCRECAHDTPWEKRPDDPCSYVTGRVVGATQVQWALQNSPTPQSEERWRPEEVAEIESCMRAVMRPQDTHHWLCFIRTGHRSRTRVFTALDSRWHYSTSIDAQSARKLAENIREYCATGKIPPRPNPLY